MPDVKRVASRKRRNRSSFWHPARPPRPGEDVVTIEAPRFTRAFGGAGLKWRTIPNLGRTIGAVTAFPQGQAPTTERDGVRLEYEMTVRQAGDLAVQLFMVPTLDTTGNGALRMGVSIDGGPMQTLTDRLMPAPTAATTQEQRDWNRAVEDNARMLQTVFANVSAGKHTVKIWRLDDDVVLQKLVMGTGAMPLLTIETPW